MERRQQGAGGKGEEAGGGGGRMERMGEGAWGKVGGRVRGWAISTWRLGACQPV